MNKTGEHNDIKESNPSSWSREIFINSELDHIKMDFEMKPINEIIYPKVTDLKWNYKPSCENSFISDLQELLRKLINQTLNHYFSFSKFLNNQVLFFDIIRKKLNSYTSIFPVIPYELFTADCAQISRIPVSQKETAEKPVTLGEFISPSYLSGVISHREEDHNILKFILIDGISSGITLQGMHPGKCSESGTIRPSENYDIYKIMTNKNWLAFEKSQCPRITAFQWTEPVIDHLKALTNQPALNIKKSVTGSFPIRKKQNYGRERKLIKEKAGRTC